MLSIFFANLLIEAVEKHYVHKLMPQCLIPVPLHKTRLKKRGFNQALEIAKQIAPSYYLPIDYYTCQRIKETQSQSLLPAKERHKNIAKAFVAQPLPYSHVALIDDVLTTGSTVNAMSMALKKQGVERIDIWTCTRTPL